MCTIVVLFEIDITDIANYPPTMTSSLRGSIRAGPIQIDMKFPPNESGRSFSTSYYVKRMLNGEQIKRESIVYSKKNDAVHCYCCFLFEHNPENKGFTSINGFNDWQNLSRTIKIHETSQKHLINYQNWKITSNEISNKKTVDKQLLKQLQAEKQRLREVFKRLIAFVILFARQNIAFTYCFVHHLISMTKEIKMEILYN